MEIKCENLDDVVHAHHWHQYEIRWMVHCLGEWYISHKPDDKKGFIYFISEKLSKSPEVLSHFESDLLLCTEQPHNVDIQVRVIPLFAPWGGQWGVEGVHTKWESGVGGRPQGANKSEKALN